MKITPQIISGENAVQPGMADHLDALLDEALQETFPASDPIAAYAPSTPRKIVAKKKQAQPKSS